MSDPKTTVEIIGISVPDIPAPTLADAIEFDSLPLLDQEFIEARLSLLRAVKACAERGASVVARDLAEAYAAITRAGCSAD